MAISEIFKYIKVTNIIAQCCLITSISVTVAISVLLHKRNRKKQNENITLTPLIVITGCDTGLGYSIVMRYLNGSHSPNQNYSKLFNGLFNHNKLKIPSKIAIVAFCLNLNSTGAKYLFQKSINNTNIELFIRQLDLTDKNSIKNGVTFIIELLENNLDENGKHNKYELHALVNNAARMVMAEYEWQTIQMIQQQFEVNVLGPIMLTAQLLPSFRKNKGRVINIVSHCAHFPLPGISVYGASKAAMYAFTTASRIELENHGVNMISFFPGSFYLHSAIMCGEQRAIDYIQMHKYMSKEQLAYYGLYFDAYQNYLSSIDAFINPPETTIPRTNKIYCYMDNALWAVHPKAEYNVPEPWRYRIYSALACTLSTLGLHNFKDKVVRRFVATPKFENCIET
ncbi:NAD(P)-binding domain,Short-chain dehydrogenase/reductase SDR [Cinara cedri]|uniref:NAD(P)-binding domain,Short-chain dehydrogenase/reductase SDR n=1 Tax=Cinara cedri TaxID=506608 RepID=A0A5E4MJJ3_9HEMI|nr:NAD(P)-binding domain,Short-chain dehydrogenase/reductase SDR [Cinara cedri]